MTFWSLEVAVVYKLVTVHLDLDGVDATSYAEREASVIFRLYVFACAVVHIHTVHLEAGTLHGDAGAFVVHET